MRIRQKLTIIYLLVAIIPLFVFGIIGIQNTRNILEQQIKQYSIEFLQLAVNRVNEYLYEKYKDNQFWVKDRFFQDVSVHGGATSYLNNIVRGNQDFYYLAMLDQQGRVVGSSYADLMGMNFYDRIEVQEALNGENSIADVYFDKTVKGYALTYFTPIRDDADSSNIIGVLMSALKWDVVHKMNISLEFAGKQQSEATHIMLIKKDGLIISCYDDREIFKDNLITLGLKSAELAREGRSGFIEEITEHGAPAFSSYMPISAYKNMPDLSWSAIFFQDPDHIFRAVKKSKHMLIGFLLTSLIITSLLMFFISKRISQPIVEISKAAKRVAKGDWQEEILWESNDEIGELIATLNTMTKDLKDSNTELKETTMQIIQSEKLAAIGEMTAGVAHELNQPLNVTKIIGQSLLKDVEKNRFDMQEAKEDFSEIIQQMDRMAHIVDHMRIFSRQTAGSSAEIMDINEIVKNAFIFLDAQMSAHNILVTKTFGDDLPKIQVDAIRIEQVLMNLITNARHALESSGKGEKRIDITTLMDTDRKSVIVEVKDNGDGVPEDLKEKIFESFFTTKEIGKGTGLGLSVSQKIIEEHKGSIELDSVHGQGATFRVFLPVLEMKLRT